MVILFLCNHSSLYLTLCTCEIILRFAQRDLRHLIICKVILIFGFSLCNGCFGLKLSSYCLVLLSSKVKTVENDQQLSLFNRITLFNEFFADSSHHLRTNGYIISFNMCIIGFDVLHKVDVPVNTARKYQNLSLIHISEPTRLGMI